MGSYYSLLAPYRIGEIQAALGLAHEAVVAGNKKAALGYIEQAAEIANGDGPAFDRMVKEYGLEKFVVEVS